jgi:hypothetical protein
LWRKGTDRNAAKFRRNDNGSACLKAVTGKHVPDPADIASLRDLAGPQPEDIDVDELACEVIQTALKRRAAA